MKHAWLLALATMGALSTEGLARAEFQDSRVQAPSLATPERGSIVGQLASVSFGAADVSRGSFSLPSPLHVASERGQVGAAFLPTYAPDQGQSEWGMGWRNDLALTRWRARGEPLFDATDGLMGPWGSMVRGEDGAFYTTGLRTMVRVVIDGDVLTAHLPDGSTWTFGGESRDRSARGTYAWFLTATRSVTGMLSTFGYTKNASGRLFLSEINYGGTIEGRLGHRLAVTYESTARPILDYRSGDLRALDQRVSKVTVFTRSAVTGELLERWHESLSYQDDALGPAFYLHRVQRTFASGQVDPALTYDYDFVAPALAGVAPRRAAKLDGLLTAQGQGANLVNVSRSAVLDVDADGRPDLESALDNTLWTQTDDGYVASTLPALAPSANPLCRGLPDPSRAPRTLVEMRPEDPAHYVVATYDAAAGGTGFTACDRAGSTVFTTRLEGNFKLGARARLVDLDRDQRPDLIRFVGDGIDIARNVSTATAFAFESQKHTSLSVGTGSDSLYVLDVNGDGVADVVALGDAAARVWYGRGNLSFDATLARFPALTPSGTPRGGLLKASVAFSDVNKDGLVDMLVGVTGSTSLLLNTGSTFQQVSVPALAAIGNAVARPYIADWVGSGNAEISYVANGSAYSIALDRASSGLLSQVDDGAGTVLSFTYDRAPAAAGLRQRVSVLRRLGVQSTGVDTVSYDYGFEKPRWHSEGRFFLGFEEVTRRASLESQTLTYFHGDTASGVLLSSIEHDDLTPGVEKVAYRIYDDVVSFGVPWKRPRSVGEGWRSTDPLKPTVLLEETEYLAYAANVCPTVTRKTSRHGTLTTSSEWTTPPDFIGSLSCVSARTEMDGTHADASLDFHYEATLARNDAGQLTRLLVGDGHGGVIVDQDVAYTADGKPASVAAPGRGVTIAEYEPATGLLARLTATDGVVREVAVRDPLTDAARAIVTRRGSLTTTSSYRYDGRERLAASWSDLGHASEARPEVTYRYREADSVRPALVQTSRLVDGVSGVFSEGAELMAADGQTLAKASRIPEGWAFAQMTARVKSTRETHAYHAKPVTDVSALDMTSLFSSGTEISHCRSSLFGDVESSSEFVHAGVEHTVTSALMMDGDLVRTDVESGAYATRTSMDPARRVLAMTDAAGATTSYVYDALGRVREVRLANGEIHKVSFDGFARPSKIERSGVGSIANEYEPETGLLSTTTFIGTDGRAARRTAYEHDGSGRVSRETSTDLINDRGQTFTFYYDGASPEAPTVRDRSGLLTAVTGDRYAKHLDYRADGKVTTTRIDLASWRSISDQITYDEDESIRSVTRVVRDTSNAELLRTTMTSSHDAFGRAAGETVEGAPFVGYQYDVEGLPAWAQFAQGTAAHGEIVTFQYDPLTRAKLGLNFHSSDWSAAVSERMDARGLVALEDVQVGAVKRHRTYDYSPVGFLTKATDENDSFVYGYDSIGLPSRITSTIAGAADDRPFARSGGTLTAGSHRHRFDSLGRVVERDDVSMTYGPLGQVESATRGAQTWTYLYDESGERIAKLSSSGEVIAAYVGDAYLDATSLTRPVKANGSLVGVLRSTLGLSSSTQNVFSILPIDSRGTVLTDTDGTLRSGSPFGDRAAHPDVSAALDFAAKAWDADLGVVRMGVRDYDPSLSRWLQPDPLFLSDPSRCVGNAVDCSLYAYAKNDPIRFVDPTGKQETGADRTAENYIAWRDAEIAKGNSAAVAEMDEFRIKSAVASAVAGGAIIVAGSETAVTELSIQAWGVGMRVVTPVARFLGPAARATAAASAYVAKKLGITGDVSVASAEVSTVEAPAVPRAVDAAQSMAIQRYWPSNMGFDGPATSTTLSPGTMIDRFGSEFGEFTSPLGTPLPMRSLPPESFSAPYNVYEVLKPLDVQAGKIAPAFGQLGGGIQHLLPQNVQTLIKEGFLRKVTQ